MSGLNYFAKNRMLGASGYQDFREKRNSEIYCMQKEAFKIMGALLVLVLAVSMSVGAVSAYTIADEDYVPLEMMSGTPVLTKYIPAWGSTEPLGHYLNTETVYGALSTGSTDQYITYTANIDFDTGSYTIADIAGYEAVNGYVWRAFKDGNYVSALRTTIADGAKVVFLLTTDTTNLYRCRNR